MAQSTQDNFARAGFGLLGAASFVAFLISGDYHAVVFGLPTWLLAVMPADYLRGQLRFFGWSIPPLGFFLVIAAAVSAAIIAVLL